MLLDDVAADFPGMPVILAHPSVPWQDEAISIATHKANVYIDLSGWSPKYFPPQLVRAASSLLQDKVLFGTDYPLLTPERWLRDFELLEVKPEVRPKILKHNAARLLGLGPCKSSWSERQLLRGLSARLRRRAALRLRHRRAPQPYLGSATNRHQLCRGLARHPRPDLNEDSCRNFLLTVRGQKGQ